MCGRRLNVVADAPPCVTPLCRGCRLPACLPAEVPPLSEVVVRCPLTEMQKKVRGAALIIALSHCRWCRRTRRCCAVQWYLAVLRGNARALTDKRAVGLQNIVMQLRKVCMPVESMCTSWRV